SERYALAATEALEALRDQPHVIRVGCGRVRPRERSDLTLLGGRTRRLVGRRSMGGGNTLRRPAAGPRSYGLDVDEHPHLLAATLEGLVVAPADHLLAGLERLDPFAHHPPGGRPHRL